VPPQLKNHYQKIVDSWEFEETVAQIIAIDEPFDFDFDEDSDEMVIARKRPIVWVSTCTARNFLHAISKWGATVVGFADEERSPT